jgi:hypothetical protein
MVVPLIIGGALALGGFIAGKVGGGGGLELFTSKKSEQVTNANQTTNTSTYAPTISRNYDFAYNIASAGSNISTKKEQSVSQEPNVSPQVTPAISLIPTSNQGGGGSAEAKTDFTGMALIGAVGLGAYLFLTKDKKGAKK